MEDKSSWVKWALGLLLTGAVSVFGLIHQQASETNVRVNELEKRVASIEARQVEQFNRLLDATLRLEAKVDANERNRVRLLEKYGYKVP